jgi:hypothetical protein
VGGLAADAELDAADFAGSGLISVALPSIVACGRFGPEPCVPFVIAASSFRYAILDPVGHRETCAKSMRWKLILSFVAKSSVVQSICNLFDLLKNSVQRWFLRDLDRHIAEG